MSFFADIRRILTLDCHESSQLLSESLDRKLRRSEKIALRLHAIGCWSCRRLKRQLDFLRQAARRFEARPKGSSDSEQVTTASLSQEAQQRMKLAIRQERDGHSGA